VLPIGISPILPDEKKVLEIKERYNGKKIVFSLGRLVSYKGFKYLVDAAKYLSDDYIILIGGDGNLKKELQEQIIKSRLSEKVKLLGRVSDDDLPNYYGACDVYCLSSIHKTEAFAIVQIEAMSCGKPVVATKIPGSGVSWVNADGESGLNVESENSKALAEAIYKILGDTEQYQKYSTGARERFTQLFKKENMIDSVLNYYQKELSCK
jgi:rhamnosyl/mannosyltransferase